MMRRIVIGCPSRHMLSMAQSRAFQKDADKAEESARAIAEGRLTAQELRGSMFAPLAHFALSIPNSWSSIRSRHGLSRYLIPRMLRTAPSDKGPSDKGDGKKANDKGKGKKNEKDKKGEGDDLDDPDDVMTSQLFAFVVGSFIASYVLYRFARPGGEHTGWVTIINNADKITEIFMYDHFIQVLTDDKKYFVGVYDDIHTNDKMNEVAAKYKEGQNPPFQVMGTPLAEQLLYGFGMIAWVVPFIFFPSFVMILTRAMGTAVSAASEGRSKIKQMNFAVQYTSGTRFHDIAGMKEAKKEITEIVDFLKKPERYTRLGAKIPTGALLLGPPGTGKTLLAKAVAGEAGIGFIPVCGSDFVELYVGMGALRVRQLFEVAKKQRCIVYIDEIDAIGMKRRGAGHGEKQEQEHTLNELLTQLDGFGSSRGQVMILASSNVPQDQLDPALIRPGRFDRIVYVDKPVVSERIEIFKVHLSKLKLVEDPKSEDPAPEAAATDAATAAAASESIAAAPSPGNTAAAEGSEPTPSAPEGIKLAVERGLALSEALPELGSTDAFDINALLATKTDEERRLINSYAERMSKLCPGFVGADIANVCNEGAILAARESATFVTVGHLERSIDRVLAGIEHRSRVLSEFERKVVAYHEAGHAVAGWFLNRADPLMKVSIVPRGGSALGYAQYLPNENHMRTANEIVDSMCVTLGGRVAEQIFFQHWSTGASDDLQKVCRMAYLHVTSFGTTTVYNAPGTDATKYVKPFGSQMSDRIDDAAKALVDKAYQKTMDLLVSKKGDMELLAKHLMEKEVLTYQDVVGYLGERGDRQLDRRRAV